jgi:hypothetical protein
MNRNVALQGPPFQANRPSHGEHYFITQLEPVYDNTKAHICLFIAPGERQRRAFHNTKGTPMKASPLALAAVLILASGCQEPPRGPDPAIVELQRKNVELARQVQKQGQTIHILELVAVMLGGGLAVTLVVAWRTGRWSSIARS